MKKRSIALILLILSILTAATYTAYHHPWIKTSDCLKAPEAHDGRLVTRYEEPVVGHIYADGFQLLQKNEPSIRVYSDTTGLRSGEYISLTATFHREGYLRAVSFRIARHRRYKIWLSVLPVILIGLGLLHYYRIQWNPFQIELREHA
jgi:hypothetical protein